MNTKLCFCIVLICFVGTVVGGGGKTTSSPDTCGYPYSSSNNKTSTTFSESDVLAAFSPASGGIAFTGQAGTLKVWYTDEHALTLGVRQVVTINKDGTQTSQDYTVSPFVPAAKATASSVQSPSIGFAGALDPSLRPIYPCLFVTDITNNAKDTSGDWQFGGTPIPPSAIYGTWKAAVYTIDNKKGLSYVTPDADPAKNSDLAGGDPVPSGTSTDAYITELVWYTSALNLQAGHTYRFQFQVHDGDQNKAGGDAGEACTTIGVQDPTPAPTISPSSAPVSGSKITICHVPPGNPLNAHPITISLDAWKVYGGLGVSDSDLKNCYVHTDSADGNPSTHGHCPGGHGGDYVLSDPNGSCIGPGDRESCFQLCSSSTAAAAGAGVTDESQERTSCDTDPKGKVDICHVPPGNTGKFLQLSISCNAWKTCKPNDGNGFHCPGGHGGDFAGSSCGIPVNTPLYNTFCAPSKTICYVPTNNQPPQTLTISPCAWRTEDGNCQDGEYGPACHGGDLETNCPVAPTCPSSSHVIWSGTPGVSTPSCTCNDDFYGTCSLVNGAWSCNCVYCTAENTCNGLGVCNTVDGSCICGDDATVDGGGSCIAKPTNPTTSSCTQILFSPFNNFNVVLFGNAKVKKSDIEGTLFVNGDLSVRDYAVGSGFDCTSCNPPATNLGLYVGGSVTDGTVSVCSGDAWYKTLGTRGGIAVSTCNQSPIPTIDPYGSGLAVQASNIRSISTKFDSLPATDSSNGHAVIRLNADPSNPFQLFDISCNDLSNAKRISVSGLSDPTTTTIVFNVDGGSCSTVDITSVGFDDPLPDWSSSIVWNFPKSKLIVLEDVAIPGMVIAPYGTINGNDNGSSITGQVIAQNLRGRVQVNYSPFAGCLKTDLTGVTNECQNTCPSGDALPPLCGCPCTGITCGPNQELDETLCTCSCDATTVNNCGYGEHPSGDCVTCKSCPSLKNNEIWINPGSCNKITKPSCNNPSNIFGEASDYAVYIISGGFTSRNNHIGGRLAANGDVNLFNFLVGDQLYPTKEEGKDCVNQFQDFTIAASGSVIFPSNGQVLSGNIASVDIGANVGVTIRNSLSGGTCTTTTPFTNTGLKFSLSDFTSLSNKLANLHVTGDNNLKGSDNNVWVFTGSTGSHTNGNGNQLEVFSVASGDAKKLFATGFWELNNVDPQATIVVNINGGADTIGFNDLDLSAWSGFSTRTVFNFPQAQNVVINGVAVQGSILAPLATLSANNGKVVGQIIAGKWTPNVGNTNGVYVQWLGGFNGCVNGVN